MKKIIMIMLVISIHLCCMLDLSASQSVPPGVSIEQPIDEQRNTRLHHMAAGDNSIKDILAIFENCHTNILILALMAKNNARKTALHIAAENGILKFIDVVIAVYAASLRSYPHYLRCLRAALNKELGIPMDDLEEGLAENLAEILSEHFMVPDNDGNTFMHLAAQRGRYFYNAVSKSILGHADRLDIIKAPAEDQAMAHVIREIFGMLQEARNNAGQTPLDVLAQSSWPCLLL